MPTELPPGTCPSEEFDERADLYTLGCQCKDICGLPEMWGRISWVHLFPYSVWLPDESHENCHDHIRCLTPILCGDPYTGRWAFMLEAYHRDDRTDPPKLCWSPAWYTAEAFGNQHPPAQRFYLHPDHPGCHPGCEQIPWPDDMLVQLQL